MQTMPVLDRSNQSEQQLLYIYNIVTGEEILQKKQVLPLLQTTILGQQHIAQHCLRHHFCEHCDSSPCASPQNAYMINAQLSYNQTTNLTPNQCEKVQNPQPFKATKQWSCVPRTLTTSICA